MVAMAAAAQGNPRIPTLFLVGDLPAASVEAGFVPTKVHLRESLAAGETTRAYLQSGAWDAMLEQMHPGDFVAIDFSRNPLPAQAVSDAARTLAGFGDGTFDYLAPGSGKLELVHSYGWYLRKMVVDVINHGGSPLLCAGPPTPGHPGESDWARYIAAEQRIPLIALRPDGTGLVEGLRALNSDPLRPYLRVNGSS